MEFLLNRRDLRRKQFSREGTVAEAVVQSNKFYPDFVQSCRRETKNTPHLRDPVEMPRTRQSALTSEVEIVTGPCEILRKQGGTVTGTESTKLPSLNGVRNGDVRHQGAARTEKITSSALKVTRESPRLKLLKADLVTPKNNIRRCSSDSGENPTKFGRRGKHAFVPSSVEHSDDDDFLLTRPKTNRGTAKNIETSNPLPLSGVANRESKSGDTHRQPSRQVEMEHKQVTLADEHENLNSSDEEITFSTRTSSQRKFGGRKQRESGDVLSTAPQKTASQAKDTSDSSAIQEEVPESLNDSYERSPSPRFHIWPPVNI